MLSLSPTHLRKYRDIAWLLVKYGRSDLVSESGLSAALDDEPVTEDSENAGPEDLAADLEQLGPTFVKLGQVLSTRADLLPPPYLDALSRLQDDVDPVPFEHIERIVTEELGVRISQVFASFDREPLASASLGQVHRATLKNGAVVAVKVQRPGIRSQVATDLDALDELATLLDQHTEFGRKYQFRPMIDSLRRRILEELDYRNELHNCVTLTENLREHECLVLPGMCEELSSSRVLTMEFLEGTKVTELTSARLARVDAKGLADGLFASYLQQVLVDGVFHADPHPGNIALRADGRLALMDFGMVVRVPRERQRNLAKILLSISEGDGEATARETLQISEIDDGADTAAFTREISRLVARHQNLPVRELDAGQIVLQIQSVAGEAGIRIPDELRMIGKTLLNLDRIVAVLDPEFDPNAAIRERASGIMQSKMSDHFSLSRLYKAAMESAELAQAAPERLNKITRLLAENQLTLTVDAIDEQRLLRSLHKIANRIATGVILAALILGASLMMRLQTSFMILGYPGIAMIFFLTAAIAGLILVYRMAFSDQQDC